MVACTTVATPVGSLPDQSPTLPATPTITITFTPVPPTLTPSLTPTLTDSPTVTPTLTPTLTPTITPTLNLQKAVSLTPAPPAKCPSAQPGVEPVFNFPKDGFEKMLMGVRTNLDTNTPILDYLNAGGTLNEVANELQSMTFAVHMTDAIEVADVTHDGNPELLIGLPNLSIIGCVSGRYQVIYHSDEDNGGDFFKAVRDINRDGVNEIVTWSRNPSASYYIIYHILEWNGKEFVDLIQNGDSSADWHARPETRPLAWYTGLDLSGSHVAGGPFALSVLGDVDGDAFEEFSVDLGTSPRVDEDREGPWRKTHLLYKWNGFKYWLTNIQIDPPQYRFQAVQDADRMEFMGNYISALSLYQQAIFNDDLLPWSQPDYFARLDSLSRGMPAPLPKTDPAEEAKNISAYSYFHIMLLHLVGNRPLEASYVLNFLQTKYPVGQPGSQYTEAAASFWNIYQSTKSMSAACQAVIQNAAANEKEFFRFLGNDSKAGIYTFGGQSHEYQPEDVCPFK